jgi:hypothetical protein
MGRALKISDALSPQELRIEARRAETPRAAARMYAIASALEGKSRDEAARCAGMDRQALRDAVVRYNAEGLDGLWIETGRAVHAIWARNKKPSSPN